MITKIIYILVCSIPVLLGAGIFFGTIAIEIAHRIQESLEERKDEDRTCKH